MQFERRQVGNKIHTFDEHGNHMGSRNMLPGEDFISTVIAWVILLVAVPVWLSILGVEEVGPILYFYADVVVWIQHLLGYR
ncbi:MAG TPA: hypothetical protein VEY30_14300 [Myxococcaceae bacterium]|nr:hypothetical protein [Myxococcaceae bacterium]